MLFPCFHGLFGTRLWHAWSASGGPVKAATDIAPVSRSSLIASYTPLHNFRYGIGTFCRFLCGTAPRTGERPQTT